jgi:hypothetical protein
MLKKRHFLRIFRAWQLIAIDQPNVANSVARSFKKEALNPLFPTALASVRFGCQSRVLAQPFCHLVCASLEQSFSANTPSPTQSAKEDSEFECLSAPFPRGVHDIMDFGTTIKTHAFPLPQNPRRLARCNLLIFEISV